MKQGTSTEAFFAQWERISMIADDLKDLQLKAGDEGCRKLRRLIAEARTEALKKSLALESAKPLDRVIELVNVGGAE